MTGYLEYIPVTEVPRKVTINPGDPEGQTDAWGHSLCWWRSDSPYFHPWTLVSPQDSWKKNPRTLFRMDRKDMKLFWDSGGFMVGISRFPGMVPGLFEPIGSLAHGGVQASIDVVRWYDQYAQKGDACMILDAPAWEIDPKVYAATKNPIAALRFGSTDEYERALTKTIKNAEKMLEIRKGDYDLFGVVHGPEPKLLDRWYHRLSRVGDFDGWSFVAKVNPALYVTALVMAHAYTPRKPVHYLGHGGAMMFTLAAYLAAKTNNRITTDSSTATRSSSGYLWNIPGTLRGLFIGGGGLKQRDGSGGEELRPVKWPEIPCDCPVCRWMEPSYLVSSVYEAKTFITLHNLYQMVQFAKMTNSLKNDREALEAVAPKDAGPLLDAIDYYLEHGIEAFLRKAGDKTDDKTPFAWLGKKYRKGQTVLSDHDPENLGRCQMCLKNEAERKWPAIPTPEQKQLNVCPDCEDKLSMRAS
jgi:hypothetical protein